MENKYCTKCGASLAPDDLYCQHCGQRTATESAASTLYPSDDIQLEQYIGPNTTTFLQEFKKIEHGQKPKFHILAFFFTLPYCYYRKCSTVFWKYLKLPYILTFLYDFFYKIILAFMVQLGRIQFTTAVTLLSLLKLGLAIFTLVRCVQSGQNFYEIYYQQYCDARNKNKDMAQAGGVSIKNMILSLLAVFAIVIVIEFVSSGIVSLMLKGALN